VHVKSIESHQVRALLSSRKMILTKCIDLENELRGLLKVFGVRLPPRVGHGGFDELVRPKVLALPELARCLLPLLDARVVLYRTYLQLDTAVRGMARHDPVCQRLMSVPGVGPVTSLTFKTAIDDPQRFRCSRTVAAHFGLTPRRSPVGRDGQPGSDLQGRRARRPTGVVRRRPCLDDPQRRRVGAKGLGAASGQDPRPSPRCHRRGAQAGGDPAPDVDQ
jgi:transposase